MTSDNDLSLAILEKTRAPALAGAVVNRDGLMHLECAGLRRLDGSERVTTEDRWHIGSNAKSMTAALYARLVEAGSARWSARIPELFPDLAPNAAWDSVTIEDLLAHRSGLVDAKVLTRDWLKGAHGDCRPVEAQRTSLALAALSAPSPGRRGRFAYANINYVLAGAAIERILGVSWETAMMREVFSPLAMTSAGFGAPTGDQPRGHAKPLFGRLAPVDPEGLSDNPAALGPAGRAHMSLADHARFVRLFLTQGDGYLKAESIQRIVTPPEGGGFSPYALGWMVLPGQPRSRGPLLAHDGSNTRWYSVAFASPQRGVAVVTASNAMARGEGAARLLAQRLLKRFDPG
ncbi:serine hydrolase domain-containing protein [Phenylobacterium sp.]|uniref:serine hydrolase domain-containing protein n=1 Tax=Phenylobacterium sp. TaxID=1871053 RepID=UPI00286C61AD|nr:serine hydrolase domain-containing protein [Phenylobacterium sp.]